VCVCVCVCLCVCVCVCVCKLEVGRRHKVVAHSQKNILQNLLATKYTLYLVLNVCTKDIIYWRWDGIQSNSKSILKLQKENS